MNSKYILLSTVMISLSVFLCGCSSGSGGVLKILGVIGFIVLFLGTSLCTALITFKLKRKKNNSDTASSKEKG